MENELNTALKILGGGLGASGLVYLLAKTGLLRVNIGVSNGKNFNGEYDKRLEELSREVKEIKENHLHEITNRLIKLEVKIDLLMKKTNL